MESFVLGVLDLYRFEDNDDLVAVGRAKGKIMKGTAIFCSNPGCDDNNAFLTVAKDIQKMGNNGWEQCEEAEDCLINIRVENGRKAVLKPGTVIYTREASEKEVHDAYISALGDHYVIKTNLDISDDELTIMSVTDLAEVWRLFNWYHNSKVMDEPQEVKEENRKRLDRICAELCKKLLNVPKIYCIYSKATGEPFLFSRTAKKDEGYICSPPNIRLVPVSYFDSFAKSYPEETFEFRLIDNTVDDKALINLFGEAFYFNGADGVEVISEMTPIGARALLAPPDYSKLPGSNIPVTNPDLVKWLLLTGQMPKVETEDEKLIYRVYYDFTARELIKARFLVPLKTEGEKEKPDENGKIILKKDSKFGIATQSGKGKKPAVRMYTDWKRLRSQYKEDWGGLVETAGGMIESFDLAVNVTDHLKEGMYVSHEMFKNMEMIAAKTEK